MPDRLKRVVLLVTILLLAAGAWLIHARWPHAISTPHLARAAPPKPQHVRGIVRDAHNAPVKDASVELYAIEDEDEDRASLCGSDDDDTPLFAEDCAAAIEEVTTLIAKHRLEATAAAAMKTDEKGAYDLLIAPGHYDVLVRAGERGSAAAQDVANDVEAVVDLTLVQREVSGRVVAGEAAIDGADVMILLARPRVAWHGKASVSGRFLIGSLPAGDVVAWASAEGYRSGFAAGDGDEPLMVSLSRLYRVSGVVTRDGTPVEGVDVSVDGRTTKTGHDGTYALDGANAGDRPIQARLGNWAGSAYAAPNDDGTGLVADLVLEAAMRLRLKVVDDATGKPIDDATVSIATTDDDAVVANREPGYRRPEPDVTELDSGELSLDPLVEGTWYLAVSAPGHKRRDVEVAADSTAEKSMTVTLERGRAVRGVVVSEAGHPITDAIVADTADGFESVRTGDDGKFLVEGIDEESESVTLRVMHLDFRTIEVEGVVPDGSPVRIVMGLPTGVNALVLNPAGHPMSNAVVEVDFVNTGSPADAETDTDGHARVEVEAGAGAYTAFATAPGFEHSERADIDVVDGKLTTTTLKLRKGVAFSGRVEDTQDHAVPGVTMLLSPLGDVMAPKLTMISSSKGTFSVTGLSDIFYELKVVEESGRRMRKTSMKVHGGDDDVRVEILEWAKVKGTLTRNGAPVPQFNIGKLAVATKAGAFLAELEPTGPTMVELTGDFIPVTLPMKLDPGIDLDLGDIRVAPLGAVSGFVRHGGKTIGTIVVSASPVEHDDDRPSVMGPVAADGSFFLRSLLPGPYTIAVATAQGPVTAMCEIQSGGTARVQIDVPADYDLPAPHPLHE